MQITAEVSKIKKSVRCDLTFIFIELSKTPYSFIEIRLVLEIKNVVSFIKKHDFIENEAGIGIEMLYFMLTKS